MPIVVDDLAVRERVIQRLLLTLRPTKRGHPRQVATQRMPIIGSSTVAVGANDKSGSQEGHRDWYFKTFADRILGQYFEEWTTRDNGKTFQLNQVCLHHTNAL